MKPPYKRFGGKRKIAEDIVKLIPKGKYTTYVEPFFGGGAVFFEIPKGEFKQEIINDKDPVVYNLIKGFQRIKGETINKNILGEYNAEDFLKIKDSNPRSFAAKFYRYFILLRISYLGQMRNFNKQRNNISTKFDDSYKERLKGVKIYNKDFIDIVNEYDSQKTFFYFDPPYEKSKGTYKFSIFDPFEFLEDAKCLEGDFIMSFNYNKELVDYAHKLGYYTKTIQTKYSSKSKILKHTDVKELLILNYKP